MLVAAVFSSPRAAGPTDWPQFRGYEAAGLADQFTLPSTWSATDNVAWATAIPGRGWSSPVILGREIWMTTANPKGTELSVVCVERDSGKIIHDQKIFDVEAPQFAHEFNSYASPTPVIEVGRLYASWGLSRKVALPTGSRMVPVCVS